jgi:hypothetical protein
MIRLKCPKCAESLTVDDEDAGGVGECGECGAKFRIPAAKAKPARVSANNATDDDEDDDQVAAGPPPRRQRRAADDDDDRPRRKTIRDEDDSEEDEDSSRSRRRKPVRTVVQAEQLRMNIQMGIALGVVAILLAAASVFINGAGFFIACGALFFVILTGIAMMITVYRDSPAWALLIFLVGTPAAVVYAIMNWDKIGKIMLVQAAFTFVCICAFIGGSINLGWRDVSRELRWQKIKGPRTSLVRVLDVALLPRG